MQRSLTSAPSSFSSLEPLRTILVNLFHQFIDGCVENVESLAQTGVPSVCRFFKLILSCNHIGSKGLKIIFVLLSQAMKIFILELLSIITILLELLHILKLKLLCFKVLLLAKL